MAIILDHVSYIYDADTAMAHAALEDVSLTIPDGQFIGLIGHTGSGKSTLVQHLNGLMKPTSGNIFFNGKDIHDEDYDRKALRAKVGLVFQYPEHQLFEADVFSDVCFGPKNLGLSKKETELRAYEALKQVGLEDAYFYQSPFDLSGGQKRRVAIAGVLAMKPEVLILDEPTAGLDPRGRDEILGLISRLHSDTGMTVVLVSHSMEDVANYVDRIIVMNKGHVAFDDVPRNVFRHYRELEQIGLAAPQVTYVMQELKAAGLDVSVDATTVEEARDEILKAFHM
ncbi:MAG: energy-coupling factor transporter ATPase [Butyrivibrio sp.]|jgi:energy-coupling factor transport system ATP-binding protein|nr:energy-coupling factor transporter ATPase [Butyrivibrio sp.]